MAMTYLYLPIHKRMQPLLKDGMRVIHNGGNGRQGDTGFIQKQRGDITVQFDQGGSYSYTPEWFYRNFWVSTGDIYIICGSFNGDGYNTKYGEFMRDKTQMRSKVNIDHTYMKSIVDKRNQDDQDPFDVVGGYLLVDADGEPSLHKTQRIAQAAGVAATEKDGKSRRIYKLVTEVRAEPITTYKSHVVNY